MNDASPAAATDSAAPPSPRRRAFLIFATVLVVAAIVWGVYWFLELRHYESTDDAYVAGDVLQVTSAVNGTILAVHADDTQSVKRGDVLVEIDPSDARIAVASAEAELARTVREVAALYAQASERRAQLAERETALARASRDLERRQPLAADGAVSSEDVAHARDAVEEQRAAATAARASLGTLEAQLQGTTLATHPRVLAAAAALRAANLALHRTRIGAPVDGVVARRSAQIGQRVAAGNGLLALVALDGVWVDANFKEVQLHRVRVGQPVTLHTDIYDSDVEFHGKVAGLAAGSGSAFALLPAQNASGNWIKIVQRVPVRIVLDPAEIKAHPLRVGLSAIVRVDVADQSGPLVASNVRGGAEVATLDLPDTAPVEARIREIIASNGRLPAAAQAQSGP
ncbi:MAG: efflux RND transporter periplasmic adaptor subunit [Proteobacteria bacterium]|nr:efflux RND transporter periplasmic adaptor subunit [Pseudomonadota bacterium]